MQEIISRAEFARRAQVTPATVTGHCNNKLKAACVGKRIDFNHRVIREYMISRGLLEAKKPKKVVGAASKKKKKQAASRKKVARQVVEEGNQTDQTEDLGDGKIHEVPDDIEAFADMSLRELIQRFGTETAFMDWLKATKEIEAINEKRLKNAETMGKLVSRDLVRTGIIEPFDAAHINLLTDGAKTIAVRVITMHDAGKSKEEIETWVSEQITTFIRPVKSKVGRMMKQLEQ